MTTKNHIPSRLVVPFFLALCILFQLKAQHPYRLQVMSWNVENLFDTVHDEGFADEEFLPDAERRWNSHRYWQKLTDVAKVIAGATYPAGMPALIGLCEVENDSVLTMLCHRSILRTAAYEYVMTHSLDSRGIDVALLYFPASFRLIDSQSIRIPSREQGLRSTRDILYVKGLTKASGGTDTLHVFVVHLPSRAGGHQGDRNRKLASETLWNAVDSVGTGKHIIVMGDFNASSHDPIFKHSPLKLTDDRSQPGTYCFRGYWEWLDHILISPSLRSHGPARPVQAPWLLESNKTYGGKMPRRTFRGPIYHGGVSDHLPIVLELIL